HLTPFPGTPLYSRFAVEHWLQFDAWWLDDRYEYNMVPFRSLSMAAAEVRSACLAARRRFYAWRSIALRVCDPVNRADPFMFRNFLPINAMLRADTQRRDGYPLGDERCQRSLLFVQ